MFNPTLLIWSKDRAGQLDLLLQSIEKFCPQFNVHILYKASNQNYNEGYKKLESYFPECHYHPEFNFRKQTLDILGLNKYVCISTDDTVLTRPFSLKEEHIANVDIFSLRLGWNTVVQEPFSGRIQPTLSRYVDEGETVIWDSRLYNPYDNYGYQFGMDMVLYNQRYYDLVKKIEFKRTNDIEGYLSTHCRDKINPFMRSFKESVAVNIPSNNISGVTQADNSLPFEEVNSKFLDGYRFRLKEVEDTKIVGCHQLISLVMERE